MSRRNAEQEVDENEVGPGRDGMPVDLRRLLRVVLRGKRWLMLAAVVGAVLGVLIAKFAIGRSYVASAMVRYEGLPGQSFIEAQHELPSLASVTSTERYLLEVRAREGMHEVHVDAMRGLLQTSADSGTGQLSFDAYGDSPEAAAKLANDAVAIFLEHHTERRREQLTRERESLVERITGTSQELDDARQAYDGFREQHGISDLSVEQESVIAQAAQLRTEAQLAAAEVEALEVRVRQLRAALAETPRTRTLSGNSGRRHQETRLAELRQRLREARGQGLGESHPQVQSLQRQVSALQRQENSDESSAATPTRTGVSAIHEERASNLATAEAELETVRQRHQSLVTLAEAAQERGNRFTEIESQAASLLAQVNVKGALVESLTERSATIDDQLRDVPTGFRSVAEAVPPESAVPSKKKKIIALALPLAFVGLVLLGLLAHDLNGMRLIAPDEVAWWGGGPVVGTSTWPRDNEALADLIADLEDVVLDARGHLLLVGAGDMEAGLTTHLAAAIEQCWAGASVMENGGSMRQLRASNAHEPTVLREAIVLPLDRRVRTVYEVPEDRGPVSVGAGLLVSTCRWEGAAGMPALRRAARRARGVLVLVGAGIKAGQLREVRRQLGREDGVGYLLLAVSDEVAKQNDRCGTLDDFRHGFEA